MDRPVKATITVGNKVITFEGPQEFVDAQVTRFISYERASNTLANSSSQSILVESASSALLGEKELIASKNPKGHPEIVAVLAFGLTESGKSEFTAEDIRRAYIRAGVMPPKVVSQAIRDAKNLRDYIISGSTPGTYKLSENGDRTVRFILPRRTGDKG